MSSWHALQLRNWHEGKRVSETPSAGSDQLGVLKGVHSRRSPPCHEHWKTARSHLSGKSRSSHWPTVGLSHRCHLLFCPIKVLLHSEQLFSQLVSLLHFFQHIKLQVDHFAMGFMTLGNKSHSLLFTNQLYIQTGRPHTQSSQRGTGGSQAHSTRSSPWHSLTSWHTQGSPQAYGLGHTQAPSHSLQRPQLLTPWSATWKQKHS